MPKNASKLLARNLAMAYAVRGLGMSVTDAAKMFEVQKGHAARILKKTENLVEEAEIFRGNLRQRYREERAEQALSLTPRQREVMDSVEECGGVSRAARALGLSVHSVYEHLRRIRAKLRRRAQCSDAGDYSI